MNEKATAKRAKPNAPLWISLLVSLVVFSGIGLIIFFHNPVRKIIMEADAGFKKATNTIDPEELRTWALENVRRQASPREISASMPKQIRELYKHPPDAVVSGSTLSLMWGGGFFHWGFYIGDTNEIMPFNSNNPEYPYNFEWRPGIYYTREANWKLK